MYATMLAVKIKAYVTILWGVIVMFALCGAIMKHAAAPYVLAITCVSWVGLRILEEAYSAWVTLKAINVISDEIKKAESQARGDDEQEK